MPRRNKGIPKWVKYQPSPTEPRRLVMEEVNTKKNHYIDYNGSIWSLDLRAMLHEFDSIQRVLVQKKTYNKNTQAFYRLQQ